MSDSCVADGEGVSEATKSFLMVKIHKLSFSVTRIISMVSCFYDEIILSVRRNLVRERDLGKEVIVSGRTLDLVSRPQGMQLKVQF